MSYATKTEKRRIQIFDTTLRDGEQSPGASLNKKEKIIIAKQLAKLGVDVIEAGFPVASEDDFSAVRAIAKLVKGPSICGLARGIKKDIDRCWEALQYAERPRIHIFIATSKIHLDKKFKKTEDQVLEMIKENISYAAQFFPEVEFSCEDAARTNEKYMLNAIETAINAGATIINVPDTVGYAIPSEYAERIKLVFQVFGKQIKEKHLIISVHCHNDLGNAVSNSLAAIQAGVHQVEVCVNGIGERAGNAALEEIIMNLVTRNDQFNVTTGIKTEELFKTSRMVSEMTGLELARNKPIVGRNAFSHEAGIHQHGILNDAQTYEIMSPKTIGWRGENLVIGKHSGKHAIKQTLLEEGYDLCDEKVIEVTRRVKDLADSQKEVTRYDVIAIAADLTSDLPKDEQIVILDELSIETGNKKMAAAKVSLLINDKLTSGTGEGVGPIDAVSCAIQKIVDPTLSLTEYNLKAITGGTDALADVTVTITDKKTNSFKGRALDQDIVMASCYAIIQGINKALLRRES